MLSDGWSNIVALVEKLSSPPRVSCSVEDSGVSFINSSKISKGSVQVGIMVRGQNRKRSNLGLRMCYM